MFRRKLKKMHFHRFLNPIKSGFSFISIRTIKIFFLFMPPVLHRLYALLKKSALEPMPVLGGEFKSLPFAQYALYKLVSDYDFQTVLDVGSGAGDHAVVLKNHGKNVTALDFGTSVYAMKSGDNYDGICRVCVDFHFYKPAGAFDCVWASHVLEHQSDPGAFIRKCIDLTSDNGVIAITVPPQDHLIVGGHLTYWNAGLLLYQLVFNGLDCREASICTYGYNVSVIVRKKMRPAVELTYDSGDLRALKMYFPSFVDEPFDGRISRWNW